MSGLVRVAVYTKTDSFIANVPRRSGVQWLDELNAVGSGSFDLHLDDEILVQHPNLLAGTNVVRFFVGGVAVKAWLVESVLPAEVEENEDQRLVTVSGRGAGAAGQNAIVYPEYGLRLTISDLRAFDYSSKDGDWRLPAEWVVPAGVRQDQDTTARRGNPKLWPDPAAQWLWETDPTLSADPGYHWFRGTFTVPSPGANCRVFASFDNDGEVRLDGEEIISSDPETAYNWQSTFAYTTFLAPGLHTLAAEVLNRSSPGNPTNPGAYLASVYTLSAAGALASNLYRTSPASTICKPYGDPPGWTGAQVVKTLLEEGEARGAALANLDHSGWDGAVDSNGAAWLTRTDRQLRIGTTDLLDVLTQVSEVGLDWNVEPTSPLRLDLFRRRGTDRRSSVRLLPAKDLLRAAPLTNYASLRNAGLVRHALGWTEVLDVGSIGSYDRREVGITAGGVGSAEAATEVARALFVDTARPEVTIPVTFTSASGPQPYVDFFVGDTVTSVGASGGLGAGRVMGLAGSEAEGHVVYTADLYPR
mgnify:CR=1 FL=1